MKTSKGHRQQRDPVTVGDFVHGCYMAPRTEWQHVLKYSACKVAELTNHDDALSELRAVVGVLVELARVSKWRRTHAALKQFLNELDARALDLAGDAPEDVRLERLILARRPAVVRGFVNELAFWRDAMKAAERRGLDWKEMLSNGCPHDFIEMRPLQPIPTER